MDSPIRNEKRGWLALACAMIFGIALALLLVFPGFLAAWVSKSDGSVFVLCNSHYGRSCWAFPHTRYDTARSRIAQSLLYPSYEVMRNSTTAKAFYIWQYELAGGKVEMLAGK